MPAMHLMSVDLPAPLSPTSAMTSPCAHLEVDVGQRLHRAERLREVADLEEWCVAHEWRGPTREAMEARRARLHRSSLSDYLQYFLYSPEQTSLRFRNPSLKSRV